MNALERRADRLFSEFIRNRDGRCVIANAESYLMNDVPYSDEGCWGELEVHHLFSRRFKATRWDPRNGASVCSAHHAWLHAHPLQHAVWRIDLRGEVVASDLLRRAYGGERPDVAAIVDQLRTGTSA